MYSTIRLVFTFESVHMLIPSDTGIMFCIAILCQPDVVEVPWRRKDAAKPRPGHLWIKDELPSFFFLDSGSWLVPSLIQFKLVPNFQVRTSHPNSTFRDRSSQWIIILLTERAQKRQPWTHEDMVHTVYFLRAKVYEAKFDTTVVWKSKKVSDETSWIADPFETVPSVTSMKSL